jgi:hypothetical protein
MSQTPRVLDAGVAREVEYRLAMFLEWLPAEHLCEQISRVGLTGDVAYDDATGPTQLAHLEHLPVDVPRVLGGRKAMA